MATAIKIDHISKVYRLGTARAHAMLREVLVGAIRSLGRRKKEDATQELWALRDVSMEIKQGELVGIIGRNGAGKSTLLKILSKITYPTSGRFEVKGRVASLLEVGSGFHEELTGRENIYMNGSILGMKKREIDAKLDQIVAFADVDKFLDTPIKRYSSGMRMRLGFSVAAHLSPDVLFVDEVLAVGDVGFQKKCLGTISELGHSGRTVLFVSHNMAAVENLCKRAIWLTDGQVREDGDSKEVIRSYMKSFGAQDRGMDLTAVRDRKGSGASRLKRIEFLDRDGEEAGIVHSGDSLIVRLHYECMRDIPGLHFGLKIFSNLGTLITETNTYGTGLEIELAPRGEGCVELEIDFLNLMPGSYYITVWSATTFEWHDLVENVAILDVEASDYYGSGRGIESRFGLIFLPCRWRCVDASRARLAEISRPRSEMAAEFQPQN